MAHRSRPDFRSDCHSGCHSETRQVRSSPERPAPLARPVANPDPDRTDPGSAHAPERLLPAPGNRSRTAACSHLAARTSASSPGAEVAAEAPGPASALVVADPAVPMPQAKALASAPNRPTALAAAHSDPAELAPADPDLAARSAADPAGATAGPAVARTTPSPTTAPDSTRKPAAMQIRCPNARSVFP